MGKRGPQAKPTARKKLEGNPGRRPISDREVAFEAIAPECPGWLGDAGRQVWGELVNVLLQPNGLLTAADGWALSLLCEAWEEFLDARKEIEEHGPTAMSESGAVYQHPAVGRKNKAIDRIKAFISKFGLSPADRVGLNVGGSVADADPLAEMLKARCRQSTTNAK